MSKARKIAIAAPSTGDEEWQALREPLSTGWLTQGPKVAEFETAFAARHGTRHAVASSSGTTALHLALAALGIGPGDEVIVPAFTWVATASAVLHCSATPIFVDVDARTYNLAIDQVAGAITARTRAIVPVHLFGLCADMDALEAASTGIPLVEDAACADGADYRGRPAGSMGAAGMFSFHPRKVMTTGEGGMLTTDNGELAERARTMRNHGAPEFENLGFNYRMTDMQAAVGMIQLGKLDTLIDERSKWADFYRQELSSVEWLRTPES
ncbi:MAG: DegT/DnrJ/EryC1/StrS family aminotransferase, partial [Deltaproteobacteria bacterium]|nr:DegT/DnrJ/EryC1/StrS family aminotransferase [Deltaproteobacteria bacterium]